MGTIVGFYAIAANPKASMPIGSIIICMGDYRKDVPSGFLACDGSFYDVKTNKSLYSVIGDSFCQPTIQQDERYFFGFFKRKIFVKNPLYREGQFRVPLMSGGPRFH